MNKPYISRTTHDFAQPIHEELVEESPYRDPNVKVADMGVQAQSSSYMGTQEFLDLQEQAQKEFNNINNLMNQDDNIGSETFINRQVHNKDLWADEQEEPSPIVPQNQTQSDIDQPIKIRDETSFTQSQPQV